MLALARAVRQQLLDHQAYEKPYLDCLRTLSQTWPQSTQEQRLRSIGPMEPTEGHIRDFVLSHWPEVQLYAGRSQFLLCRAR